MQSIVLNRRLAVAIVAVCASCVLGFYGTTGAQVPQAPFANAVEQQAEIIHQLKELNGLIKEQNALFRSGRLQVIVVDKNALDNNGLEKRHR